MEPNGGNDTELRDRLAVDRTVLANERTLLSYVRTMIACLAAGGTIIHFIDSPFATAAGVLCCLVGIALLGVGIRRFRRVARDLRAHARGRLSQG